MVFASWLLQILLASMQQSNSASSSVSVISEKPKPEEHTWLFYRSQYAFLAAILSCAVLFIQYFRKELAHPRAEACIASTIVRCTA
jgi:hypothetical protein